MKTNTKSIQKLDCNTVIILYTIYYNIKKHTFFYSMRNLQITYLCHHRDLGTNALLFRRTPQKYIGKRTSWGVPRYPNLTAVVRAQRSATFDPISIGSPARALKMMIKIMKTPANGSPCQPQCQSSRRSQEASSFFRASLAPMILEAKAPITARLHADLRSASKTNMPRSIR